MYNITIRPIFATLLILATILFFAGIKNGVHAQPRTLSLQATTTLLGSTESSLPFWFHANRDGSADPAGTNWINELGFNAGLYDDGVLSVDAGGHLVGRLSVDNALHFSRLFLKAEAGGYRLSAGRFTQPVGLNNHALSSGAMMVSRNAVPVPGISISTPDFLNVPLTGGVLQYKGMFAHRRFTGERYVEAPYLHQKYLYLRLNLGRFSGTGGIVHNAVWGGLHPDYGQLPKSFSDYLRVVLSRGAGEDSNVPRGEVTNVIGNSIAAYEFAAAYDFGNWSASATRLFYLEDGVSRRFRSPWDGVWGFNFTHGDPGRLIGALTYEHINTKQQDARNFQAIGRANYYNHGIYRSGWASYGRTIGTPLFTYNPETGRITNNMIVAHHTGMAGHLSPDLSYKLLATYSRNYGVNGRIISPEELDLQQRRADQYSFYLAFLHRLPGTDHFSLSFALAADRGTLYANRFGILFGIQWNSVLKMPF